MASTTFTNRVTPILADWLNDVNTAVYSTLPSASINVFSYMTAAQIADVQAKTLLVDVTTAVQAAITYADSVGGGKVYLPAGYYKMSSALVMKKRVTLIGAGRAVTKLSFTQATDGVTSTWAINSSTAVWISLRDLWITTTSLASTGGGFVDVGGTYVDLDNVRIDNFKYQVIFDQTELATIDRSEIIHGSGQTGVWLVNGADHTALAAINYTNRITISRTQFNGAGGGNENILDDGGANHSYTDNNFNDGSSGIRAAGVSGLRIQGNESESHTGTAAVVFAMTTKAGTYIGSTQALEMSANSYYDFTGSTITIDNLQGGTISGNIFGAYVSQAILFNNGNSNPTTGLVIEGNTKIVTGAARTTPLLINASTTLPLLNNQLRQAPATFVSSALVATGSQVITPAAMEFIIVGSRLVCQNASDGTNTETVVVTAITATTFTATFASTKTANWAVYGGTPYDSHP